MRVSILALLSGLLLPASGLAATLFLNCAELQSDAGDPVPYVSFEVMAIDFAATAAARTLGYYSAEEVNGTTVSCSAYGHEYAIGLSDLRLVTGNHEPFFDYRLRVSIDGTEVWISDGMPADPAGTGNHDPFLGRINVNANRFAVCPFRGVNEIGDMAPPLVPTGEAVQMSDGTSMTVVDLPGPVLKPEIVQHAYVGFNYGCNEYWIRMPEE